MAGESARSGAAWGCYGGGRVDGERALPTVVTWLVFGLALGMPGSEALAGRVDGGGGHSCAITDLGALRCWGRNNRGQLGNGSDSAAESREPVAVAGLGSDVVAVATGYEHSCAVTAGGAVMCWGLGALGQLGLGVPGDRNVPTAVPGLESGWMDVVAGQYHTCALSVAGEVKCWGLGTDGQLGVANPPQTAFSPVAVQLGGSATGISASMRFSCASMASGGMRCWGSNTDGQLGNGTAGGQSELPVDVVDLDADVTDSASGNSHTCAVTLDGTVYCWGSAFSGELGFQSFASFPEPMPVQGLPAAAVEVSAGNFHSCARLVSSQVFCWGSASAAGQGTFAGPQPPAEVAGLTAPITAIGSGEYHSCALHGDGLASCWGRNADGEVGDGSRNEIHEPTLVAGLSDTIELAAGSAHTCARDVTGAVRCWGNGVHGEIGDGQRMQRLLPVQVQGLSGASVGISGNSDSVCSADAGGRLQCWGDHSYYQLGVFPLQPGNSAVPVDVLGGGSGISSFSSGFHHGCALFGNQLRCWGANHDGQLGIGVSGGNTSSFSPQPVVAAPGDITSIVAAGYHGCVLTGEGAVLCWGGNQHGQVGDGTAGEDRLSPTAVVNLPEPASGIASGFMHSCAWSAGGGVWCWGFNSEGQLGEGSTDNRNRATAVDGIDGVVAVSGGVLHTCAIAAGNALWCWGSNNYGQLGDPASASSSVPIPVPGMQDGVTALSAGRYHTCAVRNGDTWCWGDSTWGQSGIDEAGLYARPRSTSGFPFGPQPVTLAPPAAGVYGIGEVLEFQLHFNSPLTVDGTPFLSLQLGGNEVAAPYAGGDGSIDDPLRFAYTVVEGDVDTDGLQLAQPSIQLNGGSLASIQYPGRTVSAELPAAVLQGVHVDGVRPVALDVALVDPSPTVADSVRFEVRFSEALMQPQPQDFELIGIVSDAAILDITGSGDSFVLTVDTGIGSGTLGLRVLAGGVTDLAGNPPDADEESTGLYVIDRGVTFTVGDGIPASVALSGDLPLTWTVVPNVDGPDFGGSVEIGDGIDSCAAPVASAGCVLRLSTPGERALRAVFTPDSGQYEAAELEIGEVSVAANQPPVLADIEDIELPAGTNDLQSLPAHVQIGTLGAGEDGQALVELLVELADPDGVLQSLDLADNGDLWFTPTGIGGVAVVSVRARDDGGTAQGGQDTSAPRSFNVAVGEGAELSVSVDNGRDNVLFGESLVWTLTAVNAGPNAVVGAQLSGELSANLLNGEWACVAGAACQPDAGTGAPQLLLDLPVGGSVELSMVASVDTDPDGPAFTVVRASITPPDGVASLGDLADDGDEDSDAVLDVGVFRSGFESGEKL